MDEPLAQERSGATDVQDLSGTKIGRFFVRTRLGAGGMGEVYKADDTKLKRPVALKRLAPHLRDDPQYRKLLLKEAERASSLTDQHVAAIYDVLEEQGEIFLVMEYVEGVSLRKRLGQSYELEPFLEMAVQVAGALVAAHEKGIVHRDIKPENIMIRKDGVVKVLDFGVAKRVPVSGDSATTLTTDGHMTGSFAGTPAYMAPEVLLEKDDVDTRADIFSLGVVLYEAFTGRHPFRAGNYTATVDRVLHADPAPVRTHKPEVSPELEHILLRMLAKEPAGRYATARELLADLQAIERSTVVPVLPSGLRWRRWEVSKPAWLGIAVALLVLVTVLGYHYGQPPVLAERGWLLMADFENYSGEEFFDRTVNVLLRQALQQSRYVNVVPQAQVVETARRMGHTEVARVSASLGREICQRENYDALLTAQITAVGSGFQITVQVIDPWQDRELITEVETLRSPEDVHVGVERLAQRLRQRLGESLEQIEKSSKPLAKVTTQSLEALKRYSRALDLYAQGELERFIALANSAVELDPDFAMAHLALANAHSLIGNIKAGRRHLTRAKQRLDRVTERERHLILAIDYSDRVLYEKATEQYRLLVELYPDDLEGFRGLARVLAWVGRTEDAIESARHAVGLAPHSVFDHAKLVHLLSRVNRFEDALAAYELARAGGVLGPHLHWGAGLAYLGSDRPEEARREFEQLRRAGGTYYENLGLLYLAHVLMYEGRMREAAELLRTGLLLDQKLESETWVPVRRYLLARVELVRGRRAAAREEARRLAELALSDLQPVNLFRAGSLSTGLGEAVFAEQFLVHLEQQVSEREDAYTQGCYYNLKGRLDLARGHVEEAVKSQQAAIAFLNTSWPYRGLARAYAARKDWPRVIEAYGSYLQFKGDIFRDDFPGNWVLAHLQLARAHAAAGDAVKAARYYDQFLEIWGHGDTDLPALRQAKAEREQLAADRQSGSSTEKVTSK